MAVSIMNGSVESYVWFEVGTPDQRVYESSSLTNVSTNQLTIKNAATDIAGSYYCRVRKTGTSCYFNSDPAVLTVTPLTVSDPADVTVCDGKNNVTLSVTAPCASTFQWYKYYQGDPLAIASDDMFYSDGETATLLIPDFVDSIHSGEYLCVVTNGAYSDTSNTCVLSSAGSLCP